ncbi:hypothetical protein KKA39_01735 [Patescibacteria group bacterium]|nr:hypothetical protein [Patescibacteria group bacterium]MBU1728005.1 hypothetical protein [Patescibacteria group bacterium]
MKNGRLRLFLIIVIISILGVLAIFVVRNSNDKVPNGKYDSFASCLREKGAVFYGTFWCTHCRATKENFGSSYKLLSYVECSTPNARDQMQACKDKKIERYPTWEFADGSRLTGEVPFSVLAEKTSCELPE